MTVKNFLNAGSIHDIPIGHGVRLTYKNHHFVVFRETYGHFYAFEDERSESGRGLHKGRIKDGKVCLPDGHTVDLHTGQVDRSNRFLPNIFTWVENGFVFLSLSGIIIA